MAEVHKVEISEDGTVQITVNGIKGKACKDATAKLEAALGRTTSSVPTSEMAQKEVKKATRTA